VEYAPVGVAVTRKNFDAHGIDPANVIEGDLFNDEFISRYESRFDVVFSRGLIEHFTDPVDAIHRHVRLAQEGGLVIITIPTLTGIHYALTRVLMPHQISIHNRAIMRLKPFRRLFEQPDLEPLFCDYFGGLNLMIAYTSNPTGFRAALQGLVVKLQILANMAGRIGGARLLRGSYLNGALVFIGRRRSPLPVKLI
jgi:SAM-dependent methyltransferase